MEYMQFCNNCGKILPINNELKPSNIICSCGSINNLNKETSFEEKQKIKEKRNSEVFHDTSKTDLDGFPHLCKKCGHNFSEVRDLGCFYGDEAGVYLFKCKKCGYTERQSDGTGN